MTDMQKSLRISARHTCKSVEVSSFGNDSINASISLAQRVISEENKLV